jgi:hypothetical protein
MTQVSTSEVEVKYAAAVESSSGLYLCSYSLHAYCVLEQPNKSVGLVVVAGVKHISSDNKSLLADRQYGHKVDSG